MNYCEIVAICEKLGFRDKLRLGQFLIKCARKEKEKLGKRKGNSSKNIISELQKRKYIKTDSNNHIIYL